MLKFLMINIFVIIIILFIMLSIIFYLKFKWHIRLKDTIFEIITIVRLIVKFDERWILSNIEDENNISNKENVFLHYLQSIGFSFLLPKSKLSSYWGSLNNVDLDNKHFTDNVNGNYEITFHNINLDKNILQIKYSIILKKDSNKKIKLVKKRTSDINIAYIEYNDGALSEGFKVDINEDYNSINVHINPFCFYGNEKIRLHLKVSHGEKLNPLLEIPQLDMPEDYINKYTKPNYLIFCSLGGFNFIAIFFVFVISFLMLFGWYVVPIVIFLDMTIIFLTIKLNMKLFGIINKAFSCKNHNSS